MADNGGNYKSESGDIDLHNRDPNDLNGHLKVGFDEVLGEPDSARSIGCVWSCSSGCFNCGKSCCYKLLTTLTGICIALYWGCLFACVAYQNVWCLTPVMKLFKMTVGLFNECFGVFVDCCIGSYFKAAGYMFSRIRVQQG